MNITLENDQELEAYFGGYRHYGNIIRDVYDIYPIFYKVRKDGQMSSKLLNNVRSWDTIMFKNISRADPMTLSNEIVKFYCDVDENLNHCAHDAIMAIMTRYAKMHPGLPKIYLGFDSGADCIMEYKYDSLTGTILAISIKDGKLLYDVNTQQEYENNVSNIYIPNEKYLLTAILEAINDPLADADEYEEKFFNYVKDSIGQKLRLNGLKYYEAMETPGPLVTVLSIQEDNSSNSSGDDLVTVKHSNGNIQIVPAKRLEPLSESEKL